MISIKEHNFHTLILELDQIEIDKAFIKSINSQRFLLVSTSMEIWNDLAMFCSNYIFFAVIPMLSLTILQHNVR
jgi:hypothetical protein